MAYPLFKFEIQHESFTGSIDITDYTFGWEDVNFVMERDDDFHSLVEMVEVPLIFRNYAKDLIIDIVNNYGVDTEVFITLDISYDEGETYEIPRPFEGSLQLVDRENIYKGSYIKEVSVPIIQNQFWQKFSNRKDTPVKVGSTEDLDGGTIETVNSFDMNLPSQIIRYENYISSNEDDFINGDDEGFFVGVPEGVAIDTYSVVSPTLSNIEINELEKYYSLGEGIVTESGWSSVDRDNYFTDNKLYFFKSDESGDLNLNVKISYHTRLYVYDSATTDPFRSVNKNITIGFKLVVNRISGDRDVIDLSGDYTQNVSGSGYGASELDKNHTLIANIQGLKPGDELYLYGTINLSGGTSGTSAIVRFFFNNYQTSFISMVMNTTFQDTICDAYMIHDVGYSISNTITGQNTSFYSQYLGNQVTQARQYAFDGEGSYISLMNGIHVRGKTMEEKPFTMSFMDWWNGINPLENLCLFHDVVDGIDTIQVEEKEQCYINTYSITFSNIEDLVETEDSTLYTKSVEIGFKKWKSEEIGALDDPQTKHTYALRFKTFGKDVKILSEFYMASIGIEVTRRKDIKETEDWKLDDDVFAIATVREPGSGDLFNVPELDENFDTISNLLNSDLRYNIRYSPARALLRWGNWLSQGLIKYDGAVYKFTGGEGNYDMTSELDSNDHRGSYGTNVLAENQDIQWDETLTGVSEEQIPVQTPVVYEFSKGLTNYEYTVIKNNKRRSIRISSSDTDYINVFVKRLSWNPAKGMAEFTVMKAN